ncbi:MAG: DUF6673 family protein [Romboutsia sp.]
MKVKVNDRETELEFCVYDPDVMEKYENALEVAIEETTFDEDSDLKLSEKIRIQCKSVFKFFNSIFGEGTDKKVFGEKVNLKDCLSAFQQVIAEAAKEDEELANSIGKYTPNRAQRRKSKK